MYHAIKSCKKKCKKKDKDEEEEQEENKDENERADQNNSYEVTDPNADADEGEVSPGGKIQKKTT